jgi:hypothetical protein
VGSSPLATWICAFPGAVPTAVVVPAAERGGSEARGAGFEKRAAIGICR